MTATVVDDASYGQVGTGRYDPETKDWFFQRKPDAGQYLVEVQGSVKTIAPASRLRGPTGSEVPTNASRKANPILHNYPELVPSTSLLPELAGISESVSRHTAAHEPLQSSLIALGRASRSRNVVPNDDGDLDVLAFAGGPVGECVYVLSLHQALQGSHERGASMNIDVPKSLCWRTSRTAVLQLCFSGTNEQRGSHLAVRSLQGTTVLVLRAQALRPVHELGRPASSGSGIRIGISHVLSCNIPQTGGAHHVDVCFNPWNEHQLAILDTDGKWSVWSLNGCCKTFGDPTGFSLVSRSMNSGDLEGTTVPDGWGRLSWAGDADTLLTARRTSMNLSNIRAPEQSRRIQGVRTSADSNWILDLQFLFQDRNSIVVLTSHHLLLARLRESISSHPHSSQDVRAEVLYSVLHHRDASDPTLQLQLLEHKAFINPLQHTDPRSNVQLILCISARTSGFLPGFRFARDDRVGGWRLDADPFSLNISLPPSVGADARVSTSDGRDVQLLSVQLNSTTESYVQEHQQHGRNLPSGSPRPNTFDVLALHSDFRLIHRMYAYIDEPEPNVKCSNETAPLRSISQKPPALICLQAPFESRDRVSGSLLLNDIPVHGEATAAAEVENDHDVPRQRQVSLSWLAELIQRRERAALEKPARPQPGRQIAERTHLDSYHDGQVQTL